MINLSFIWRIFLSFFLFLRFWRKQNNVIGLPAKTNQWPFWQNIHNWEAWWLSFIDLSNSLLCFVFCSIKKEILILYPMVGFAFAVKGWKKSECVFQKENLSLWWKVCMRVMFMAILYFKDVSLIHWPCMQFFSLTHFLWFSSNILCSFVSYFSIFKHISCNILVKRSKSRRAWLLSACECMQDTLIEIIWPSRDESHAHSSDFILHHINTWRRNVTNPLENGEINTQSQIVCGEREL